MTRGVEQRVLTRRDELGLLREYSDASRPLHLIRIKEGIPGVHPPHLADAPAQIQETFRERRLACVHMGADADYEVVCFYHKNSFCIKNAILVLVYHFGHYSQLLIAVVRGLAGYLAADIQS